MQNNNNNNMNDSFVKSVNYYEELIAKLNDEYDVLQANSSSISREELIEREKDLDKRLKEVRDLYNDVLEYEQGNNSRKL